jgi:cysteine synthase
VKKDYKLGLEKGDSMSNSYYKASWQKWPLPVMSVPDRLNPFYADEVDLSIVLASHLPYENIKFLTVLGLLMGAEEFGVLRGVDTLVEATSGNTGVVIASMARAFGIQRVKLIVAPDLPDGKRYPLILAGAEVLPPEDGLSPISTARKMGNAGGFSGMVNLDQYANLDGARLHEIFTGPKILAQVSCPPTVFVTGVGTGGTLVGISRCFRNRFDKIRVVGVLCAPGQEIPGVRDLHRMKEITLPWKESLDVFVEIETRPSYLASLWFNWVMGITPGPSSGFAYLGALKFLKEQKDAGTLDSLRNSEGRVHVVILFPDGNRPYGDRFMANLLREYLKPTTAPLPWQLLWQEN